MEKSGISQMCSKISNFAKESRNFVKFLQNFGAKSAIVAIIHSGRMNHSIFPPSRRSTSGGLRRRRGAGADRAGRDSGTPRGPPPKEWSANCEDPAG